MNYTTTWLVDPVEMVNLLRMNASKQPVPPLQYIPRDVLQRLADDWFVASLPPLPTSISSYTSQQSSAPLGTLYKQLANKYFTEAKVGAAANVAAGTPITLPFEVLEVRRTYSTSFIESILTLSGRRPPIDVSAQPPYVVQSFAHAFLAIEMIRLRTHAPYGDILKRTALWWYDIMASSIPSGELTLLTNEFDQIISNQFGVVLTS